MSRVTRLPIVLFIVSVLVAIDQVSKLIALRVLEFDQNIDYFGGTFRWVLAKNRGAFLSLGSSLSDEYRFWLLTAFNGVILVVVALFVLFKQQLGLAAVMALSLILAGGLGNLIDRVFRNGEVIDFMNLGLGDMVRTGVFNVADLAIVGGLVMLILIEVRNGRQPALEPQRVEQPEQPPQ